MTVGEWLNEAVDESTRDEDIPPPPRPGRGRKRYRAVEDHLDEAEFEDEAPRPPRAAANREQRYADVALEPRPRRRRDVERDPRLQEMRPRQFADEDKALPPRRRFRPNRDEERDLDVEPEPQPRRRSKAQDDDRQEETARRELAEVNEHLEVLSEQIDHLARMSKEQARPASALEPDINERLETLTEQISHLARLSEEQTRLAPAVEQVDETSAEIRDAIARLDRRLDQLIAEGRTATSELELRMSAVDRTVASIGREPLPPAYVPAGPSPLDQALAEIADRQRSLDGEATAPARHARPQDPLSRVDSVARAASLPHPSTQDLSGLEQQLRNITTRIEALSRPCGIDQAVDTLRDDLAQIGLLLQEAMPRHAVEALEAQVKALTERLDQSRNAGADNAFLAGVEGGLAEVRDALRGLTPAENLVGFQEAVIALADKVSLLSSNDHDPAVMAQLEAAIEALHGIVSHIASHEALTKLADEVGQLAAKVDLVANSAGSGVDTLNTIERRIATLADALEMRNRTGDDVSPRLESVVAGLTDKIERLHLTRADHAAVAHLEDRIANLVEKLDASDARLGQLESVERGLADLLVHLEHQRAQGGARAIPPEVDELKRDIAALKQTDQRTKDSIEAVHGTLGHVVDRLAQIETGMRSDRPARPANGTDSTPAPAAGYSAPRRPSSGEADRNERPGLPPAPALVLAAATPSEPVQATSEVNPAAEPRDRRPIDPDLPPDHPLEPGSGTVRDHFSPAERIAASEAALGSAKPPVIPDPGGKSNFIAAARRAAQAAASEAPGRTGPRLATKDEPAAAEADTAGNSRVRTLIIAASVVLLVLGSWQIISSFFRGAEPPEPPSQSATSANPDAPRAVPETIPAAEPNNARPSAPPAETPPAKRQSLVLPVQDTAPVPTPPAGVLPPVEPVVQPPLPPRKRASAPDPAAIEATGSVRKPTNQPATTSSQPTDPATTAPDAPSGLQKAAADKLPAAIGGTTLRAAAASGDPAAEYEIALRYAEGRGVPQNLKVAAVWFERAAKQGLALAQFRLGGLYEKGIGVKKDVEAARRAYFAAAQSGNAKSMHNLAVIYAEGIDGKPDYRTAARWFRKAADHGVADSQYNLGILYGRGIGVEQNLAEAYKWFTLASASGDQDAAKKRDEVGARLDQQSLMAARLAAQTWTPAPQPEAATSTGAPSAGWDAAAAATRPPPRKPRSVGPKVAPFAAHPAQ
jgi:localization factor PodJL